MKGKILGLMFIACTSCIGVDTKDATPRDPILNLLSDGKLSTTDKNGAPMEKGNMGILALKVNEKQKISLEFFNQFGVKETPIVEWIVEKPSVATVANNEITAKAAGTTQLSLSSSNATATISLTVVADASSIAAVQISLPNGTSSALQINQSIQLSVAAKNIDNQNIDGKTFQWFSENSAIIEVSTDGLITAKAEGTAEIHAKSEGVKSNILKFNVGTTAGMRTGTFQSAGGYSTVGSVSVEESGGKVIVKLSNNFQASVALGTFIYLANSTSGSNVKSSGLELAQWSNGARNFDVQGVTLNQYKYVVVLCKPAGITFGFAELKP